MTSSTIALVERLKERADGYRLSGPSAEHTATLLEEAATTILTLQSQLQEAVVTSSSGCLCKDLELPAGALASPVATREDVIRECIAVAEALPPMRKISDAHVKATSPKDVASALSTLLKEDGR